MLENRRHLRFRQPMDMTWRIPGEEVTGQGKILNISTSGGLVQFDQNFKPSDKIVALIPELAETDSPFATKKGIVVWFRKLQNPNYSYQCGVEFVNEANSSEDLESWIEKKTAGMSQAMNASILNNYMS